MLDKLLSIFTELKMSLFVSIYLNFSPSIDFNSHVFFDNICVSISNCDLDTLIGNIRLFIFCNKNCKSMLISYNNISLLVNSSFISQSLSCTVTDLTSKLIITLVPGFKPFIVMNVGFFNLIYPLF